MRLLGSMGMVVALAILIVLNMIPHATRYPETLSGIWDAPWTDLKLLGQLEREGFLGVQYGFPFTAYEHWHHRDRPAEKEHAVTIGMLGNALVAVAFLIACRKISKVAGTCRNQGALVVLILLVCGCRTGSVTDQEMHPDCYRPARYRVEDLPRLVDRLGDATMTDTPVYLIGGDCAVGDEAMWAIMEIIPDLPLRSFVPPPYSRAWEQVGAGAYYEYVRADPRNRIAFREAVKAWIATATPVQRSTWGMRKWIPIEGY